jgi:hypothetical protein
MSEYPEHPITKETRARNSFARFRTRKLITEYIYDQTGCKTCKLGEFCSRDGDKRSCLTYGNIASHLNHIGHPTSRGNKWSGKTIRIHLLCNDTITPTLIIMKIFDKVKGYLLSLGIGLVVGEVV